MNNVCSRSAFLTSMSDGDFHRLSEFIHFNCGIKMPAPKKGMLETRLKRRLTSLGLSSFSEYCSYLFSDEGIENELSHMIDAVTTNKTDFFREPAHFHYLIRTALPELVSTQETGIRRRLMAWSAGCSTGEEPYTLAMVLNEFAESHRTFHYTILATDISTRVLEKARLAIYRQDEVRPVPLPLKKKYLMRSKDQKRPLVRIVPELRAQVKFEWLNLMTSHFNLRGPFDLIFCRNVLIYFDRPSQERLIHQFYRHLSPGGYLFLGHSEILGGLHAQLVSMAPTVYRKPM